MLAYNYVISESESSIESTYFQNLFSTIDKIREEFIHELSSFKDAYAKILNQLEQKNSIAIVIDDKNISSHLVLVPKEGIKEKNQIIKYASEKIIKYPLEESIYNFKNNENQHFNNSSDEFIDKEIYEKFLMFLQFQEKMKKRN